VLVRKATVCLIHQAKLLPAIDGVGGDCGTGGRQRRLGYWHGECSISSEPEPFFAGALGSPMVGLIGAGGGGVSRPRVRSAHVGGEFALRHPGTIVARHRRGAQGRRQDDEERLYVKRAVKGETGMKAVLFRSANRFERFHTTLEEEGVGVTVLDFADPRWLAFDFDAVDFVIYFPTFGFSSNHPLALHDVKSNLAHIARLYPKLAMFPDPRLIRYYNDKYSQYLFLTSRGFPIPDTLPLSCSERLEEAARWLGFPMVVKNRYGSGGEYVETVSSLRRLKQVYRLSRLDLFSGAFARHLWRLMTSREHLFLLLKARSAGYPLYSFPLLAQRFVSIDRDLKTVVNAGEVVEGHWRRPAREGEWKMNIDGGGIGEWSFIPPAAVELSRKLAAALGASWLNIDLLVTEGQFLVSEFSPVWHHYRYKEKPSFVYKDDYNLSMPLEKALDLERIIVESLVRRVAGANRSSN
jgi:hypothetical protein